MFIRFGCVLECLWVFRLCMVKKMLYIEKAPKGKTPNTWHFWSVKIPKPPYTTSVQIIGLLPWLKIGLSEKLLVTVVLDHPVQIIRVLPVLYRYHTDYQFRNTSNCTMYSSQSWDGYRKIWSWEKSMVSSSTKIVFSNQLLIKILVSALYFMPLIHSVLVFVFAFLFDWFEEEGVEFKIVSEAANKDGKVGMEARFKPNKTLI